MHSTLGQEAIRLIKEIVLGEAEKLGVKVEKIILFGSRARGDYREDSDWDILVVVKNDLDWRVKTRFYGRVHRRLVESLKKPVDLLVVTGKWFRENAQVRVSFEAEVVETGVEIPV